MGKKRMGESPVMDQPAVKTNDLRELGLKFEALKKENQELRPDADRYRLLRLMHHNHSPLCVVINPKLAVKLGADCPSEDRLDSLLDNLMPLLAKGE